MLKLQFKENPGRGVWLVGENLRIGSDTESDIVLDGLGVQPLHAEIAINGDELSLNSQSPGSCYVNDLPVGATHPLNAGDELRIGKDRLLIVDPKQKAVCVNNKVTTGRAAQAVNHMAKATGWRLTAQHAKLKDRQFPINGNCTLGRSKDVALSIPYKLLSREHAEFSIAGNELHVKDLGSSNGCFVNGEQVTEARLKGGETVAFAKLAFTVVAPAPKAKTAVADDSSINKTMIRQAVSLANIDKNTLVQEQRSVVEMTSPADDLVIDDAPAKKQGLALISLALVLAAAVGLWLLL